MAPFSARASEGENRVREAVLRLVLLAAGCLALAGCTVDESKNGAARCASTAGCSDGFVCYRDFCVPGPAVPDGLQSTDTPTTAESRDASSPRGPDAAKPLAPRLDASEPDSTPSTDVPGRDDSDAGSGASEPIDAGVVVADSATSPVTPPACSREVLRERADAYLAAMASGDTSALRKHASLRYTENGQTVQLGLGVWTSRPKAQFMRHVLDEASCGSVLFGVLQSITGRTIIGVRLRYVDEQLLEAEAQVVPQNFQFFNPAGIIPDGADPWVEPVPPAMRTPRAALNQLVSNYFESVTASSLLPPFDPGCRRRQDGVLMAQQGSCGVPPGERAFTEKRYPVVDETNGIATAIVIYERYVGMYLFKVSGGTLQNIDIVGGAQARSSGW